MQLRMTSPCAAPQWGPPEYHVQSLRNLQEAMLRTKRLCATIVDTVGEVGAARAPML
jgi:hypothetical protein